jgi:DNA repair exonuclease SbcCD ATPase subunit
MSELLNRVDDIRKFISSAKGAVSELRSQKREQKDNLEKTEKEIRILEKARIIIQTVAQMTQQELEFHISELVSLALETVFENPYKLKLVFELRRNKTEADLFFSRDGADIDPLTASGGGVVDVAAFALRASLWNLSIPHVHPVLILDEPFRFVRGEKDKVGLMLQEISEKLGLQIIMITQENVLTEYAHRSFQVTKAGKRSKVTQLKTS